MNTFVVDIGGTNIKYGVINDLEELIFSEEVPTKAYEGGPALISRVCKLIEDVSYDFDKIGISTSGQVNSEEGSIIFATESIPNFTGCKIKKLVEERFNKPVQVENDVNCAVLGESRYGAGKDSNNIIMLTIGTGIGGGIIINNGLYTGSSYSAGEFGHIITHPNGISCTCGHSGCYERYASTTALVTEINRQFPEIENGREIMSEVVKGNISIIKIVDKWCYEIALGLTSLIHSFNPDTVIIGGGIMANEILLDKINQDLDDLLIKSFKKFKLSKPVLDNTAGLYGAFALMNK